MSNLITELASPKTDGLALIEVRVNAEPVAGGLECECGDSIDIEIVAVARSPVRRPNLGYAINLENGELVFSEGTLNHSVVLADLSAGQACRVVYRVPMDTAPGTYLMSFLASDNDAAASGDSGVHHDARERAVRLRVRANAASSRFDGMGAIPFRTDFAIASAGSGERRAT
ncbi:Wzt carbohydrate-binding domain-containing protein [Aurantimonas litoralis]|nr:Wzt carbohydrate-binding domain-containing protein [Aurantimonas litoralis]